MSLQPAENLPAPYAACAAPSWGATIVSGGSGGSDQLGSSSRSTRSLRRQAFGHAMRAGVPTGTPQRPPGTAKPSGSSSPRGTVHAEPAAPQLAAPPVPDAPAGSTYVGRLVIEIVDTGTGLLTDDPESLFKEYQQSASALTARAPGSGLGLYVVRTIVTTMGGRCSLKEERRSVPNAVRGGTLRIGGAAVGELPTAVAAAGGAVLAYGALAAAGTSGQVAAAVPAAALRSIVVGAAPHHLTSVPEGRATPGPPLPQVGGESEGPAAAGSDRTQDSLPVSPRSVRSTPSTVPSVQAGSVVSIASGSSNCVPLPGGAYRRRCTVFSVELPAFALQPPPEPALTPGRDTPAVLLQAGANTGAVGIYPTAGLMGTIIGNVTAAAVASALREAQRVPLHTVLVPSAFETTRPPYRERDQRSDAAHSRRPSGSQATSTVDPALAMPPSHASGASVGSTESTPAALARLAAAAAAYERSVTASSVDFVPASRVESHGVLDR